MWKICARIIDIPATIHRVHVGIFFIYRVMRHYCATKHNHTRWDGCTENEKSMQIKWHRLNTLRPWNKNTWQWNQLSSQKDINRKIILYCHYKMQNCHLHLILTTECIEKSSCKRLCALRHFIACAFCSRRFAGNAVIAVPHTVLLLYSQGSTCSYYYCSCHIHGRSSSCDTHVENKEWVYIKCTRTGQTKCIWTVT